MVYKNMYRYFIWHKSYLNICCLLCYFPQLLLVKYLGPDFLEIDLLVVFWFLKVSRDFLVYVFKDLFGFQKVVRKMMVSRVKFHILMRSSTMIWSRNITCYMCGTAPSFVWYIQHLVQDRDLLQHHNLGPQEEQSCQQQNIEDTKNNYDLFFDVVKNG